ncbi:MAG TPA: hypothetical protein VFA04_27205 [Bryobacteraceae bacterium]|nr:hypothetical protein [Bryobacteraceae bacterium]
MKLVLRRNGYSEGAEENSAFNIIRTPAGWLQAIPLVSGAARPHVESDTPAWQSVTARNFYAIVGALLAPLALVVFVFAAWALTSQMKWTASFLFTEGPLADWMIWALAAVLLRFCASALTRAGQR